MGRAERTLGWGHLVGSRSSWFGAAIALSAPFGIGACLAPKVALFVAAGLAGGALITARPAIGAAILPAFLFFESFFPTGVIVPVLALGLALLADGRTHVPRVAPLAWGTVFVLWALVSAMWTPDLGLVQTQFQGLMLAFCFCLAAPCLIDTEDDVRLVLNSFVTLATLTGGYAIFTTATGAADRAEAFAGDPNLLGMYEVVAMPMAVLLLARARTSIGRAMAGLATLVIAVAVLSTVSRGALIALGVILLATAAAPTGQIYASVRQHVLVVASILVFAAGGLAIVGNQVSERSADEDIASGSGRVNEWKAARTAFLDHPLVGVGFGGFYATSNQLLRSTPGVDLRQFRLAKVGQRVHSAFIGTAAELGGVGILLLLGLVVSTAGSLWATSRRRGRSRPSPFIAGAATAILIGFAGFLTASLFLSTEGSVITFLFVGLAAALRKPLEPAHA